MTEGLLLTASPEFVTVAMEEVREMAGGAADLTAVGNGSFFWEISNPRAANRMLVANPPVFLHHLHTAVAWDYQGPEYLRRLIEQRLSDDLHEAPPGCRVAVQGRSLDGSKLWQPRELKQALDLCLCEQGFIPTVKSPDWVVSVTLAPGKVYYGVSPAEDNLSDWSGGMIHFRKSPADISRSKFKLLEAVMRWKLQMPSGGVALDLGAAPGGWTSVLLDCGLWVTAVDTGCLDERLAGHPRLTFMQQNVKDLSISPKVTLDVITCDMSWDPFFTVRAVNRLVDRLVGGGQAILTVKLMGKRPRQTVRQVIERLDERLLVMHAQHLFHNRQEVTLHLQRG